MSSLPLLGQPGLDATFAWLPDGPRSAGQYLADIAALQALLETAAPTGGWLLNLCQDRYRFAVGFAAGLLAGKTSLQPASQSPETLRRLQADYPGLLCLCDSDFDSLDLPRLDFPAQLALQEDDQRAAVNPENPPKMPLIPAGRVAAILFTSGSTGHPQAHAKTWGKLLANGRAEAERLGLLQQAHAIVGTVPVQHSYGFESTFLMAMAAGGSFWAGKPFFPQDIAAALAVVPQPRLLVTTPFHLSALLSAEVALPPVDLLLSATAPLSGDLARCAEAVCQAPLFEIYGSTESGQLASRRTTEGDAWQLLPGIRLTQTGDVTTASGGHVEGEVPLGDLIELAGDGSFTLVGRHADLVNIAGKRTSLAYLNHQITAIAGVADAAFFLPDEAGPDGITRLAAFVVAPGMDRRQLLAALRQRIDAIFLPRPLVFVDALPRNSTGKLPRSALQALFEERLAHGSH
ncbi:AMP-binding protein [Dechloromonas sp.]|uniref:AMP-binding protein n=1 Tax=Dechloromonas sp. TaxID=1917218 RepID=UPI00121F0AF3|nr:AMP-binding protein [Dechloromonas sp.]MBU3695269.1 acyl-CoA synthetase [Dechloromonas sp.]TEX49913.1 MAG: beta-hydroxyacyl-ACP dehydratase [Rhodocyclaceae bacterium]